MPKKTYGVARLRSTLANRQESLTTRYAVKHYVDDRMCMPTKWLTMRTLRHTCIMALRDASCVREQIRAITGQRSPASMKSFDRYAKSTADQADAALAKRLAHQVGPTDGPVSAFVRR